MYSATKMYCIYFTLVLQMCNEAVAYKKCTFNERVISQQFNGRGNTAW